MQIAGPLVTPWQARLDLAFERREAATILRRCTHSGPLRLQKPLYPEGEAVCHGVVLHPPAGIAGGDALTLAVSLAPGTHALLTTPGAGKWYRSAGPWAAQTLQMQVGAGAVLEWLPQETIVFDGALARLNNRITLAAGARVVTWDVLCLGRRAAGERFTHGALRLLTRIDQDGRPLWLERGQLTGNDPLLLSPVGLAGRSVSATLLAAGQGMAPDLLAACRAVTPLEAGALFGLTALPGLMMARYLGDSSEAARQWFIALWQLLRPAWLGRAPQLPRIWST